MNFDLLKAFGYIERAVKIDFFLSHHYLGPGLDQPPYFHRDPYTEYTLAFMGIRARQ